MATMTEKKDQTAPEVSPTETTAGACHGLTEHSTDNEWDRHLLAVNRPARYLGGEVGSVVKDHSRVEAKIAMAFPDTYEVGMSHLGLAILYKALNQHPRIACERVFAPWFDMEAELTATGKPLCSLESGVPLAQFDIIGFSLQHELTYTNVLQMLKLAGIPLRSEDRTGGRRWPLIIAGGPCANHPEPVAPFFDAFFIGEGEAAFPEMVIDYVRMTRDGVSMHDALTAIAAQAGGGLYIPALHETMADPATGLHFVMPPDRGYSNRDPYVTGVPAGRLGKPTTSATGSGSTARPLPANRMGSGSGISSVGASTSTSTSVGGGMDMSSIARRQHPRYTLGLGLPFPISRIIVPDLDQYPFPSRVCVPLTEAVFDRLSVEIARGCDRGCRFCEAGFSYRPKRERNPQSIVKTVLDGINATGFDEVGLTSLSTADYSAIETLITHLGPCLAAQGIGLSVSSLRAYGLKPSLLKAISQMRTSGLTLAPEAGTQRMRDVINKNITEDDLLDAASNAFRLGWNRLKLYFMMGLPTETDQDVEAIAETAKRVLTAARRASAAGYQSQTDDQDHQNITSRHNKGNPELSLSVSCHVPRPHTPFQWEAMDSLAELERKQRLLGQACKRYNIKLRWHNARISRLECILARGDRRLADTIETAFNKGCRFDGWDEFARLDWWDDALQETVGDVERYTGALPVNSILPWFHINTGVNRTFLIQERERAYAARNTIPCGVVVSDTPGVPESTDVPNAPDAHNEDTAQSHKSDQPSKKFHAVCYHCGLECTKEEMVHQYQETTSLDGSLLPCPVPITARAPSSPTGSSLSVNEPPVQTRFRLLFAKVGKARMLGHLDLVRHFPRLLKRAGARLALTKGFHPKPHLVFGPALRLGALGMGEYLDFIVQGEMDQQQLANNLAAMETMDGLILLAITTLPPQAPSISKSCAVADWLVVPGESLEDDDLLTSPPDPARGPFVLPPELEMKGAPWPLYQAAVINLQEHNPALTGSSLLSIPGIQCRHDGRALLLRVSAMEPMVRPESLLSAWAGRKVEPISVIRAGIWSKNANDLLTSPILMARSTPVENQVMGSGALFGHPATTATTATIATTATSTITTISKPDWPTLTGWSTDVDSEQPDQGFSVNNLFSIFSKHHGNVT